MLQPRCPHPACSPLTLPPHPPDWRTHSGCGRARPAPRGSRECVGCAPAPLGHSCATTCHPLETEDGAFDHTGFSAQTGRRGRRRKSGRARSCFSNISCNGTVQTALAGRGRGRLQDRAQRARRAVSAASRRHGRPRVTHAHHHHRTRSEATPSLGSRVLEISGLTLKTSKDSIRKIGNFGFSQQRPLTLGLHSGRAPWLEGYAHPLLGPAGLGSRAQRP